MKLVLVTYLRPSDDLSLLLQMQKVDECWNFILEHRQLSRFGCFDSNQLVSFAKILIANNIFPILAIDLLLNEKEMKCSRKILSEIDEQIPLENFSAIRVFDVGMVKVIRDYYPRAKIHLMVENSGNSAAAMSYWKKILGEKLSRIVLSTTISKEEITTFIAEDKKIEVLIWGKILLSYSRRFLLGNLPGNHNAESDSLTFRTDNLDSGDKDFIIVRNNHGTFVFHHQDLYWGEYIYQLIEMGVKYFRIDLRFISDNSARGKIYHQLDQWICNFYTNPVDVSRFVPPMPLMPLMPSMPSQCFTTGFLHKEQAGLRSNRLRNEQRSETSVSDNYLGEVVEVTKEKYIAILIKKALASLDESESIQVKVVTPCGKSMSFPLTKTDRYQPKFLSCRIEEKSNLLLFRYRSGVVVRSKVYII